MTFWELVAWVLLVWLAGHVLVALFWRHVA